MGNRFVTAPSVTLVGAWLVLVALLAGSCAPSAPGAPSPEDSVGPTSSTDGADAATSTDSVGLANPASVYCADSGGSVDIRTDSTGGQQGYCVFPDGSECEEWALFRGQCLPGDSLGTSGAEPADDESVDADPVGQTQLGARFESPEYGFTMQSPAGWTMEAQPSRVIFTKSPYFLFVGFKRVGEEVGPFRTGMPAGEFEPGGDAALLGQDLPKRLLVFEGRTKVVEYAAGVGVGDLRLSIWLDGDPAPEDYMEMDIPDEVIAEADAIVSSFTLTTGVTPAVDLDPVP